jgi:tryptophan synthase alpha chain
MNAIDELFNRLRRERRKALIPFITAGDPNLEATAQIVKTMVRQGASAIEIGFPYSDPIADGPVIQASYGRALANGLRIDDIFHWSKGLHRSSPEPDGMVPFIAMVSYGIVYRRGPGKFLDQASESGFTGVIVPDLPFDEAQEIAQYAGERDLSLIQLSTPTTPRERVLAICQLSTGFLYCVSVKGITGERDHLPEELTEELRWLRQQTSLPLCVGFGISSAEHVRKLRDFVDGLIVGSALVRKLENARNGMPKVCTEIGNLLQKLAAELNPSTPPSAH